MSPAASDAEQLVTPLPASTAVELPQGPSTVPPRRVRTPIVGQAVPTMETSDDPIGQMPMSPVASLPHDTSAPHAASASPNQVPDVPADNSQASGVPANEPQVSDTPTDDSLAVTPPQLGASDARPAVGRDKIPSDPQIVTGDALQPAAATSTPTTATPLTAATPVSPVSAGAEPIDPAQMADEAVDIPTPQPTGQSPPQLVDATRPTSALPEVPVVSTVETNAGAVGGDVDSPAPDLAALQPMQGTHELPDGQLTNLPQGTVMPTETPTTGPQAVPKVDREGFLSAVDLAIDRVDDQPKVDLATVAKAAEAYRPGASSSLQSMRMLMAQGDLRQLAKAYGLSIEPDQTIMPALPDDDGEPGRFQAVARRQVTISPPAMAKGRVWSGLYPGARPQIPGPIAPEADLVPQWVATISKVAPRSEDPTVLKTEPSVRHDGGIDDPERLPVETVSPTRLAAQRAEPRALTGDDGLPEETGDHDGLAPDLSPQAPLQRKAVRGSFLGTATTRAILDGKLRPQEGAGVSEGLGVQPASDGPVAKDAHPDMDPVSTPVETSAQGEEEAPAKTTSPLDRIRSRLQSPSSGQLLGGFSLASNGGDGSETASGSFFKLAAKPPGLAETPVAEGSRPAAVDVPQSENGEAGRPASPAEAQEPILGDLSHEPKAPSVDAGMDAGSVVAETDAAIADAPSFAPDAVEPEAPIIEAPAAETTAVHGEGEPRSVDPVRFPLRSEPSLLTTPALVARAKARVPAMQAHVTRMEGAATALPGVSPAAPIRQLSAVSPVLTPLPASFWHRPIPDAVLPPVSGEPPKPPTGHPTSPQTASLETATPTPIGNPAATTPAEPVPTPIGNLAASTPAQPVAEWPSAVIGGDPTPSPVGETELMPRSPADPDLPMPPLADSPISPLAGPSMPQRPPSAGFDVAAPMAVPRDDAPRRGAAEKHLPAMAGLDAENATDPVAPDLGADGQSLAATGSVTRTVDPRAFVSPAQLRAMAMAERPVLSAPVGERPRTPVTRAMLAAMPPTLRPAQAAVVLGTVAWHGQWDANRLVAKPTADVPVMPEPVRQAMAPQGPNVAATSHVQLGAGRYQPALAAPGRIVMPPLGPPLPAKPLVDRADELALLLEAVTEAAVVATGDRLPVHVARLKGALGKAERDLAALDEDLGQALARLSQPKRSHEDEETLFDWLFGKSDELSDEERQKLREKAWGKASELRGSLQEVRQAIQDNRNQLAAREALTQANQCLCLPLSLPGSPPLQAEILVHPDGDDEAESAGGKQPIRIQLAIQTHHMGTIGIALDALGQRLTVGLQVPTGGVQRLFETVTPQLHDRLDGTGYQIDSIGVQLATHELRHSLLIPGKRTKWGLAPIERVT